MKKAADIKYLIKKIKDREGHRILKNAINQRIFHLCEKIGIHVTPIHYYSPIPDTRRLRGSLWAGHSELAGINMNDQTQLNLLHIISKFKNEYENFSRTRTSIHYEYYVNNDNFGAVDGEILYCIIRHFKPSRLIEIGSGFSTCLAASAILKNNIEYGIKAELISIDPYPNDTLKRGFAGFSRLIITDVQNVNISLFNMLGENDVLFIDSSHVLKIGSDVQYLYLEVLPRLNKGVIIHAHDIFFPFEYPKDWVFKMNRFWTEQYLLQAFLIYNNAFEILWAGSYMHFKFPQKLEKAFNTYNRKEVLPSSFWMRKK